MPEDYDYLDHGSELLEQAVAEVFGEPVKEAFSPRPVVPVEARDAAYMQRAAKWCAKALSGKAETLSGTPEGGRNHELNKGAWVLYRYALAGHLDVEQVTDTMRVAAVDAGLGTGETEATLASAYRAADRDGPLEPPLEDRRDPFADLLAKVDPATGEIPSPGGGAAAPSGLVAASLSGLAEMDDEWFWSSREVLDHIRLFAQSRRASPYAVLGVVLMRVLTVTPPYIVLPALVGGQASLNSFIALVGRSGGGKGTSMKAARQAVELGEDVYEAPVGSGEGIAKQYAHRERGELVRDRDAVLFDVEEIDSLRNLGARQGATLLPELRKAWSGEKLGFAYADPTKAIPIPADSYRLCAVVGVQPARADALLDDSDGGTPQRFLWLPVTDLQAPAEQPPTPKPWQWSLPGPWVSDMWQKSEIDVPGEVRTYVARVQLEKLRGTASDALDGHGPLARMKVAAALTLLDRRQTMALEDWQLAGHLEAVSLATRQYVQAELSEKAARSHRARGEAEAGRAVVVADRVAEAAVQRAGQRIAAIVAGGSVARSEVRRRLRHELRGYFDEALDALVTAGQVEVVTSDKGEHITRRG